MAIEACSVGGIERLAYKYGVYAIGFILAKQMRNAINGIALIDPSKLNTSFDNAR